MFQMNIDFVSLFPCSTKRNKLPHMRLGQCIERTSTHSVHQIKLFSYRNLISIKICLTIYR